MILWAVLLLIIGLAFVHFLVYLNRKGHRKIIGLTFALLLMAGTAVHVVLLARSGHTVTEGNWIQLALVSLVAGLEMFIGHTVVFDDIIAAVIFREPALMIAYLTVFVLILLFTLSMVVLIMPRRLRDRTWLILNAYKASRNRKNHIFLGLSPYSKLLAKSILQEWEGSSHKGKGEIIFVEFPSADAHHSELSIGELVSSIFGHKKELTLEEELGSEHFVLLKGHRPSGDGDNMCHAIGLDKLDKWLQNPRTSLYILNQDEQENFELLKTLARDKSVQAKGFFYTHEPDSFFSLFAHMGKRLRVLDSHYLSFMQIKLRRPEVLPVNYVDIATDKDGAPLGYVKDGLKSMIVGFGESGQEALRYLLEFGSFIGKDLEAAPSSITVYDDNLEKNRGHFLHLAPALKGDKRLRWRAETAGTDAFWEQYDAMLDEGLRYMVIAMDKGNRNVSLAIHLLQRAAQKGMDLRKMIILVRIWRSDPNIEELQSGLCTRGCAGYPHFRTHGDHLETGCHQRPQPQADGHPLLGSLPGCKRKRRKLGRAPRAAEQAGRKPAGQTAGTHAPAGHGDWPCPLRPHPASLCRQESKRCRQGHPFGILAGDSLALSRGQGHLHPAGIPCSRRAPALDVPA